MFVFLYKYILFINVLGGNDMVKKVKKAKAKPKAKKPVKKKAAKKKRK